MNMEDRLSRAQAFLKSGQGMLLTAPWHRRFLLKFPSSAGTIFLTAERRFSLWISGISRRRAASGTALK